MGHRDNHSSTCALYLNGPPICVCGGQLGGREKGRTALRPTQAFVNIISSIHQDKTLKITNVKVLVRKYANTCSLVLVCRKDVPFS